MKVVPEVQNQASAASISNDSRAACTDKTGIAIDIFGFFFLGLARRTTTKYQAKQQNYLQVLFLFLLSGSKTRFRLCWTRLIFKGLNLSFSNPIDMGRFWL